MKRDSSSSNNSQTTAFSRLHRDLQRGIADLGFSRPTPIQESAIPPLLDGRDALACAMTGSGKTAAFLLPTMHRLLGKKRGTTRALVLAPTRELAAQVVENFNDLARHTRLRAAAVYGGVGMNPQEKAFRDGVDLIVACPGRLLDHFQHEYARLSGLEILILDEADRMLDMGFLPDIRRILRHLPKAEQRLLFSATMPRPIAELSRDLLHKPVQLNVERKAAPATGIDQAVFPVRQDLKTKLLFALVRSGEIGNALVFTRTKRRADRLARSLNRLGAKSERIHGDRSQSQRTRALEQFKTGKLQILVATDIAARGIDVEALSHVVNFDVPHLSEDYIHRVGRTARAGATGEAFTFLAEHEMADLVSIERAVGKRIPRRYLEDFDYDAEPSAGAQRAEAMRQAAANGQRPAKAQRQKARPEEGGLRPRRRRKPAGGKPSRAGSATGNTSGSTGSSSSKTGKNVGGKSGETQSQGTPKRPRRRRRRRGGSGSKARASI